MRIVIQHFISWYKEISPPLSFSNAHIFWLIIAIAIAFIAKILQVACL
jgi:hypothetical protein